MNRLASAQFALLQKALCQAFISRDQLAQMVRLGLDKNLNEIVGGGTLNDGVFQLIQWAESHGQLVALAQGLGEGMSPGV